MRTLSKSREEEFKKILLEKPKQPICFNEQEIWKATINISTKEKDKVDSQVKRDKQQLCQIFTKNYCKNK